MVLELLFKDIISEGVQERIARTDGLKEKNRILYDRLQNTCTTEALMNVCDILVGFPNMRHLGEAMKGRLHTGKYIVY